MPDNIKKNNLGKDTGNDSLPELIKDDSQRTMLHTEVANSMIRRLNSIWKMTGKGGIRIYKADGNVVISYEPEDKTEETQFIQTPSQATGSIINNSGSIQIFNCVARYA